MYAPVEAEDSQRLATAIRPEDQASLIEEEAPEHRFEICFELPQMPVDQVFAEARNRYGAICERAGVALPEPLEMTAAGFEVFLEDQRRDSELLDRANDLVAQGHHDLAVIVAQTACEVLVADAMRAVARGHASDELYPWLLQRVGSYTLIDNQTRKLWNALSATSIQQEPWWSEYREHVRRRNQIVHEGQRVDVEAARASLAAARALFEYVEQTVATVGE